MDKREIVVLTNTFCMEDPLTVAEKNLLKLLLSSHFQYTLGLEYLFTKDVEKVYKLYCKLFGTSCKNCLDPMIEKLSFGKKVWYCSPECYGG